MTHTADFIEEVLHEVNVILQDLADEATARGIVRAVYDKVHVGPVHTERARKDELVALMETTRDLCVAHLLGLARRDFSTSRRYGRRSAGGFGVLTISTLWSTTSG
jgi:hypothetical protein